MLKFYFDSVMIYFIILVVSGIVFHKQFKEGQKKLEDYKENEEMGYLNTTLFYLGISFIPVIRFFAVVGKLSIIFNPDKCEEILKESEKNKNE